MERRRAVLRKVACEQPVERRRVELAERVIGGIGKIDDREVERARLLGEPEVSVRVHHVA